MILLYIRSREPLWAARLEVERASLTVVRERRGAPSARQRMTLEPNLSRSSRINSPSDRRKQWCSCEPKHRKEDKGQGLRELGSRATTGLLRTTMSTRRQALEVAQLSARLAFSRAPRPSLRCRLVCPPHLEPSRRSESTTAKPLPALGPQRKSLASLRAERPPLVMDHLLEHDWRTHPTFRPEAEADEGGLDKPVPRRDYTRLEVRPLQLLQR